MHEDVRKYYNNHVKEEDNRLSDHPFEVPVLLHFIERYLVPGRYLFDVACGTGRIAQLLLNQGYYLGLNDLSDKNIDLVNQRLENHRGLLFTERADALKSKGWSKKMWDGILILGPLYHMLSKRNRLRLLSLAYEHLKPGGYVFSSFMTRAGALVYGIKNNPRGILYPDGVEKLWNTGSDKSFVEATKWFTHAYFAHPEEVTPLVKQAGLKPLHLAGAEGVFGERFELYHQLDEELKEPWMDFIIRNCEDPHMVQQSKHLLSVAQKPL